MSTHAAIERTLRQLIDDFGEKCAEAGHYIGGNEHREAEQLRSEIEDRLKALGIGEEQ